MPRPMADGPVRKTDYLLVGLVALLAFGTVAFSGRPLTMHEARLPQTGREMLATHGWLLPTSGGRPWLERPPLPHWVVAAAMAIAGRVDSVPVVRLPSAVMGTVAVLLTVWMAGRCFGRTVAVLSGLTLTTAYEFYVYAGSAEDDVYLAALVAAAMALFVRRTFPDPGERGGWFWSNRPWDVWAFFAVVGLTNLAKGPLLGVAFVGSTVGAFAVWDGLATGRWATFGRYTWLWGWAVLIGLTLAWPLWALHVYPDVADNWRYDYLGRMNGAYADINQPWWYYGPTWAVSLLPWTPACVVGLLATAYEVCPTLRPLVRRFRHWFGRQKVEPRGFTVVMPNVTDRLASETVGDEDGTAAPRQPGAGRPGLNGGVDVGRASAWRFVWCWAFVPLMLLSVPHGKHHHYLVPLVAPSAILAAVGVREIGRFLLVPRGPAWGPWAVAAGLAVAAWIAAVTVGHAQIPVLGLAGAWTLFLLAVAVALSRHSGRGLMAAVTAMLVVGYGWAMAFAAGATDHTLADTAFLIRARGEVPATVPLLINAKLGPVGNLDFFRVQFYSRPDATLLHNLSYLRSDRITAPTVYVIARGGSRLALATLGTVDVVDASDDSHEATVGRRRLGNFTLFRLTFAPGLTRYPPPPVPTSLQAMERSEGTAPGPFCGPPL